MSRKLTTALLLGVPIAFYLALQANDNKPRSPNPSVPNYPAKPPAPAPSSEGPFLTSLPERNALLRSEMILREVERLVRAGGLTEDNWQWTSVTSKHGDFEAVIPVMADALRLDGVRVTPSFRRSQQIADVLGIYLLTPHVADLIQEQSGIKILSPSFPWNYEDGKAGSKFPGEKSGAFTARMVDHSRAIDERVVLAEGAPAPGPWKNGPNTGMLNQAGKIFAMSLRNWEVENLGANYGLYDYAQKDGMIQGPIPGLRHSIDYTDYIQTFRGMGPIITIVNTKTGRVQYVPTDEVVRDPKLAPLLTGPKMYYHKKLVRGGVLPGARHPSIPLYKLPPTPLAV